MYRLRFKALILVILLWILQQEIFPLSTSERGLSLSNHLQIFINRRSAQITNPREFAHIHLTCDSPINNQSFYLKMFRCKNKKAMIFRPPLYQKMYPIFSVIVEKMPVKSIKMFCFRLQVPCYNVATKYVPLLRCTTLDCFHPFFHAVWNSAYNFCTTSYEVRAVPFSEVAPRFIAKYKRHLVWHNQKNNVTWKPSRDINMT